MPRNARCVAGGLTYHVTQRGTDGQKVFFTQADRKMYLSLVKANLLDAGVDVLAYCLMTNHVHFVVTADRDDSLAVLFRRVHGRYAQFLNLRRGRSGHLWQSRFYSCPLAGSHLWMALRYVERNPCRAGIVSKPEEYRWSSAAAHLSGKRDEAGILDVGYWVRSGGIETWAEMHNTAEVESEVARLRACTYGGRPFGGEDFVEEMETRFQRVWRKVERGQSGVSCKAEISRVTSGCP